MKNMAQTDMIADMLTMIRNSAMAKNPSVVVPSFKIGRGILEILKNEGYIENFKEQTSAGSAKTVKVYLRYDKNKKSAMNGLQRVSRPGLRKYAKYTKMPSVLRGFGQAIVSTSQGIMTDKQARERKLGGEILCRVW